MERQRLISHPVGRLRNRRQRQNRPSAHIKWQGVERNRDRQALVACLQRTTLQGKPFTRWQQHLARCYALIQYRSHQQRIAQQEFVVTGEAGGVCWGYPCQWTHHWRTAHGSFMGKCEHVWQQLVVPFNSDFAEMCIWLTERPRLLMR